MTTAQQLVDALVEDSSNYDFAIQCLSHDAALVRVNAIETIARFSTTNINDVIAALSQSAIDSKNKVKLLGNTTVAHVAIANLLRIGTAEAIKAANNAIEKLPAGEHDNLNWYLASEEIITSGIRSLQRSIPTSNDQEHPGAE